MSSAKGYSDALKPCNRRGDLDLAHERESPTAVLHKCRLLARRIRDAQRVVFHTGAGISTAAGISDFRGPDGIWTREARGEKAAPAASIETALPTLMHMAIRELYNARLVHYVVSQNVDALHLRSGLPRCALSELHGNLFVEWCDTCGKEYLRERALNSVGFRRTGRRCDERDCEGYLTDKALDWDDALPEPDFERAKQQCDRATLCVVVGTSCQMDPARHLPFRAERKANAVAIVNLSRTQYDDRVAMSIREKCDVFAAVLLAELKVPFPLFRREIVVRMRVELKGAHVKCRVHGMLGEQVVWLKRVEWCAEYSGVARTDGDDCVTEEVIDGGVGDAELERAPKRRRSSDAGWGHREQRCVGTGELHFAQFAVQKGQYSMDIVHADLSIVAFGAAKSELRLSCAPGSDKECTVAVCEVSFKEEAEKTLADLEWRSERELAGLRAMDNAVGSEWEARTWFVRSDKRRGWQKCVVCEQEVWSGSQGRQKHFLKCICRKSVYSSTL